jgi:hypothetical protein
MSLMPLLEAPPLIGLHAVAALLELRAAIFGA